MASVSGVPAFNEAFGSSFFSASPQPTQVAMPSSNNNMANRDIEILSKQVKKMVLIATLGGRRFKPQSVRDRLKLTDRDGVANAVEGLENSHEINIVIDEASRAVGHQEVSTTSVMTSKAPSILIEAARTSSRDRCC